MSILGDFAGLFGAEPYTTFAEPTFPFAVGIGVALGAWIAFVRQTNT